MLPWHQKKEYTGTVLHNKSSVITSVSNNRGKKIKFSF